MTDPNRRTIYTATYNSAGQVTAMLNNLSSATENRSYNNLLQLTGISNAYPAINVSYGYSAGANNGRIANFTDNGTGDSVQYQYDALNRLTAATTSGRWSASYTYDGFSNLTGKAGTGGAPTQRLTVDPTTNRPPGYDVNGYPYAPGQYDTEGHQVTNEPGTWWVYDPWGRRIWQEGITVPLPPKPVLVGYGNLVTQVSPGGKYGEASNPQKTITFDHAEPCSLVAGLETNAKNLNNIVAYSAPSMGTNWYNSNSLTYTLAKIAGLSIPSPPVGAAGWGNYFPH